MKKPSDRADGYEVVDLLGLGSQSVRKNYYPALQARIEELEQERNRYKWLFEKALHGIFQANLRGGFLACNPAMAKICGYASPEDLKARVIRLREQLFCSSSEFDVLRQELLNNGSLSAREIRLRRADATPVNVAITLLRRPDLGPEVVEAFVADITERVQARQKLVQMNADLEQRVQDRTKALQDANAGLHFQIEEREKVERELVVAAKVASDANRSKDKYLAAASHDLLQPLNAARLTISALQESALPAEEARMVHQVHRALEGAEDLLADLLDISKLDQQAMVPDLLLTDVAALAKGLGEEFEAVATNAGLRFHVRTIPALIKTDQRMLTRILRNLLSNAFRYTRSGRVLLALRARRDSLRIEVWDTGVGIEESKLRDIFTEFHQLLPQGSGGRQGAGLGLAIVERMVSVLGYRIELASRPGRGSRFSVVLPVDMNAARKAALPAVQGVPGFAQGFAGIQILVIDNEPAILASMKLLLERWGCLVITSTDEHRALDYLRETNTMPAAVLADYHLDGGKTGWQAIEAVRKLLGTRLPAALVTADCSDELRRQMRAQHLPILNKPVKPNRLRALLTSLLSTS
ncbi:NahK/ErcS family hybrid sensor histidine kinase/response regulator [Marinobacter sp. 2_MG-2023]|uniref:PAS domain-containing hybrid sensor histidine kinase/response regulator n=1 Tax=Marinobacter sp. 2_MG-2023 TaxID=3062679 RepID=UPI0026E1AFC7|nr:NahK/ErcS family hybrid sensor histidine kinase/response regulator [Marinobacter sp. 2_MG-2023]MDO6443640.1 NahK/ErcS family hybrid sensor histidine kinase/response regulator [Marinobacter sp. 2_MG-2023]